MDPINPVEKTGTRNTEAHGAVRLVPHRSPESALSPGDHVSLNADSLVESLREEVSVLKNELPALIQESLLAPGTDQAVAQQPLNALIFRLQNPLETILGAVEDKPEELFVKIEEELESFKLVFPTFSDNELLRPFLEDPEKAGPLTDILTSLTGQVDSIISNLRNI